MKTLLLLSCLFVPFVGTLSAQSSAELAADLQSADASHWPAIEALLIAQRDELTAAHQATLATVSAQLTAALAERDAAQAALAAKQARIKAVLETKLAAEVKQNAALNLSDGPRSKLLRELIAEAAAPEKLLKRQALEAEITAKKKELEALK